LLVCYILYIKGHSLRNHRDNYICGRLRVNSNVWHNRSRGCTSDNSM